VIDANPRVRLVHVIRADSDEIVLLGDLDPLGGVDARDLTRVVARREPGS
jgi:hypothetical protein